MNWSNLHPDLHVGPKKPLGYVGYLSFEDAGPVFRFLYEQPDVTTWMSNAYPDPRMLWVHAMHIPSMEALIQAHPCLSDLDWGAADRNVWTIVAKIQSETARHPD